VTLADLPAGFGGLLRHLRDSAGLTQEELATQARVGVNTISELERGRHLKCHVQTARRLAVALGLTGTSKQSFIAAARGLIPPTAAGKDDAETGPGVVRYSLPPDAAAFTGRAVELDQVTAAVTSAAAAGGVVAIHAIGGMPGAGKTALAVHAAHLLAGLFPHRQLFIDLHAHTPGREPVQPEDALAGLLAAAGVDPRYLPADLEGRAGMWRDKMAGQRALLVLDNAASSSQVTPLLPGGGDCLVLVTSRRHLGDLPCAVIPIMLDALTDEQAQEMFTRLAPRAGADPAGVAEVVSLAGFLPLAVSLLARVFARHPSWTLADLAAETRDRLLTLTAENDSIAAAFEVSYRHLDPAPRRFFRLLGLHPGTAIDAYAAAALAGTNLAAAAGFLDGLHAEGLLTETGYRRYGMHDLLRLYARDHAAADPAAERDQALERLLDYYQHTAASAQARLARQTRPGPVPAAQDRRFAAPAMDDAGQALAWARADRDNLLACLDHAARAGQHARIIALTAGLAELVRRDGPWTEAITRHATALQAARHLGDHLGEANTLTDLGDVRQVTDDYPAAAGELEQALAIYRGLGNRLGQANALTYLGHVRQQTGDYPGATRDLEQALAIYRELGNRLGQANALTYLGDLRRQTGDYPGAASDLRLALDLYRDLGDRLGQANARTRLGFVRQLTGDYLEAASDLKQALALYRDLGDRLGRANARSSLGIVRQLTGDYPGAIRDLEQALATYSGLGSRLGEATALTYLGDVRRQTGDFPGGASDLERAIDLYRDLGIRLGEANALTRRGIVRQQTGDYRSAGRDLEQALAIYGDLGDQSGVAEVLNEIGALYRASGELDRAGQCHQQALELARVISSAPVEASALVGLGRCAIAAGQLAQAGALLEQAHKIFQRIGAADASSVLAELESLTASEPAKLAGRHAGRPPYPVARRTATSGRRCCQRAFRLLSWSGMSGRSRRLGRRGRRRAAGPARLTRSPARSLACRSTILGQGPTSCRPLERSVLRAGARCQGRSAGRPGRSRAPACATRCVVRFAFASP
jgi:tetratricopeptide (TPR) repeat protein/transcriptional regulator with XRE-family HTH domain